MFLNHHNIVKLYGFFHDKDNIYLIMEYCSGGHLLKKINDALEEGDAIDVLSDVF